MKRLHFRYEMHWLLDRAVRDHHFVLRCRPQELAGQHCESFSLSVTPDTKLYEVRDGFGNCGVAGAIPDFHDRLCVEAEGVVEIAREQGGEDHPMYHFPSAYTAADEELKAFLAETEAEWAALTGAAMTRAKTGIASREGLIFMMDRLYRRFVYVPGVTTVNTTAAEAFAGGQGVCQDYAHILIALCREGGMPARYVAGMLPGEGATHAWCEVWLEDGWLGMDPTHNCLVDDTYIVLTRGRDFADAAVDKGVFLGYAAQKQEIYVKVEEVT